MSRRSRRQSDATVTLFPFLAVLICTMGSLIVLLVVVVQQAGQELPEPAAENVSISQELPRDVEKQQQLQQLKEDLAWQAEMLTKSREETLLRLKEQQTELSRAEDQARQIKAELDRLYAESENLANLHQQQSLTAEQVTDQQAALQKQIDDAAMRLAQAQDAVARKKRQYALVPYEGPNGTQRRPIYIECHNDRVVLQPEGVILESGDFLPPVESDNALASAIRAIREYYINNGIVRSSTEPYPLIVVRPEGASAFAACRGALSGWDDDFGYELLPDDMELAYPPVDSGLRALLERTVEEARWRKQKSLVPDQSEMVLSVDSRSGGFVRNGGDRGSGVSLGSRRGREGVFGSEAGGPEGALGATGATGAAGATGASGGVALDGTNDASRTGATGRGSPFGEARSGVASSENQKGKGEGEGMAMRPGETNASRAPGDPRTDGQSAGGQSSGASPRGGGQSFDALAGVGGNTQDGQQGGQAGGRAGGRAGAGGQAGGQPGGAGGSPSSANPVCSIARTQGANWALPGAADGAIAIQRPVNVRCDTGRLELLPEAGTGQSPVAIPWAGGTESAVREMVSALWTRVDSWGIAGAGAYWKPVIEFSVAPDSNARYEEVAALLKDSGIVVVRR